jgi:hypothetical protein
VVGHETFDDVRGVIVFSRRGPLWEPSATLVNPDPVPFDLFGSAVAVDDDIVVVADTQYSADDVRIGGAHVYRFDGTEWRHAAVLTPSDGEQLGDFGYSVSIDDDVVVVGARKATIDGHTRAGAAYVFRYDGSEWIQEAKLEDPDPDQDDGFGNSVSIADDVIAIGAHGDGPSGAAFVHRFDGERHAWHAEAKVWASDPENITAFGFSVAINETGNLLLIGAPFDGPRAGAAYVLRRNRVTGEWREVNKLTPAGAQPSDAFGAQVGISNDLAIIGMRTERRPGFGFVFAGLDERDCNANGVRDGCESFITVGSDTNGNGVPDECEARGDLNGDGAVNFDDLQILLAAWGPVSRLVHHRAGETLMRTAE